MEIGLDISRLDRPQRTGTEQYAFQVAKGLLAQAAVRAFRLRLYARGKVPRAIFPADSGPWSVRTLPCRKLWTHRCLRREVRADPPDALFVPAHVLPVGAPPALPQLVTIHDLGYLHFPEAHPWRQRLYLRWSTRYSARHATRVIADSRATADDLIRYEAIPAAKIEIVYPGWDDTLRPVTDSHRLASVRRRYRLPEAPYLLYVGTLQPRKNITRLLQAWQKVIRSGTDAGAVLVLAGGSGWLLADLPVQIEALGLVGRVFLPGYIAGEDLPALLSGALAFVFPSLFEGFGLPVLEAMACATPVLTANSSSLPEVAGDAALLIDPRSVDAIANGIRRLLAEPALRADLVRRGKINLRRFSWPKAIDQIIDLLERITA